MNGNCYLCNKDAELSVSHIIPKFVINWLKESAPSAIRGMDEPNKRVQDGEKQYLLCLDCEGLFASWEKLFCENLFLPLHSDQPQFTPIRYGSWALKFAVSVSWRVLMYYQQTNDLDHLSDKQKETAKIALNDWRGFLLGELPHPGRFEQHLLPVDAIKNYSGSSISPFLNRYLLRSVGMSVICTNTVAIVYTKMGHLILFGFIQEDTANRWKGTKLHVNKGNIISRTYRLPDYVPNYWNEQADRAAEAFASVSPKQSNIIKEAFVKNANELADSEIFRAMQYDVHHSGQNAFKITEADKSNES